MHSPSSATRWLSSTQPWSPPPQCCSCRTRRSSGLGGGWGQQVGGLRQIAWRSLSQPGEASLLHPRLASSIEGPELSLLCAFAPRAKLATLEEQVDSLSVENESLQQLQAEHDALMKERAATEVG